MKKVISILLVAVLSLGLFAGCAGTSTATTAPTTAATTGATAAATPTAEPTSSFDTSKAISVVSREEGSGTRGAFIELTGVEEKAADGTKTDKTTKEAVIADKTDVMMTNIANDPYSIGYVSLGSLNDTIKALDIDGVKASAENVKNGTYKLQRPFNIATKGEAKGLAKDFIDFILSKEGQKVIVDNGYIAIDDAAAAYAGTKPSGKIVIAGSSSVTPVMEKLKEAYIAINPNATIEIQMSDSTAGMKAAMDGTCDIGMASRELKDTETAALTHLSIALDGIAMVVNNENPLSALTTEQVKSIYVGQITMWSEVE
jgi:phosphate transport system substrate-binding protein